MFIFTIAVNYSTHDEVKSGSVEPGLQFASVMASTEHEAHLVAAQMVACHGVMPTRTTTMEVFDG